MATKVLDSQGNSASAEIGVPVASENLYPYRVGVKCGLIAGAAMALAMALWGFVTGAGVWYPVNLIAATVMRGLQTASPEVLAQFNPVATVVGTLIHLALSVVLGLVFATVLPTLPGSTMLWALIVGILLWAGTQYVMLPLINPRMEQLVNQPSFLLANVAYSLVLGWRVSHAAKLDRSDRYSLD